MIDRENLDFDYKIEIGIIHVHHLTPLSEIGENYLVDPIKDLRPVCYNCHAIVHKRNPPFSIQEVKNMIELNQQRVCSCI